jgi:hypothetical protein
VTDIRCLWTPLPSHVFPDGRLRLSVYVSPRPPAAGVVGDYQALIDWPSALSGAEFAISVDNGPTFTATPGQELDSGLWARLFPDELPIKAFEFEDHSLKNFHVFPVRPVLWFIEETYAALAAEAGLDHPSIDDPGAPLRPFADLAGITSVIRDLPSFWTELQGGEPLQGEPEGPQPRGQVLIDDFKAGTVAQDFMQGYRFYYRPGNRPEQHPKEFEEPYAPKPKREDFDFARTIAMLGDFPRLLRRLGLIVDLAIEGSVTDEGVVRVEPPELDGVSPVTKPLGTRFEHHDHYFWSKPADHLRMAKGMLRLSPEWFDLFQIDVDGALMKIVDFADTLSRLRDPNRRSEGTPGEAPVPTLRDGGLAVSRWGRGEQLLQDLATHRDTNLKIEKDHEVVFDTEDLIRGYRVDVWDADGPKGPRWYSLHQRRNEHTITAGGGEIVDEDEGFLKGTSATSEREDHPSASKDLYLHETMFGWEGWSLSAPRPGTRIVEHGEGDGGGDVSRFDPAADNPLPIRTTTAVGERSLPRLRFGHTYRMRARLVDLAGNSLDFAPGDFSDPNDDLASPERRYLRYEPIPSPTVLRRHLDTEGESLEDLVIRSNGGTTPADYATSPAVVAALAASTLKHEYREDSQRHLAPPKTSQLMAELHGRFDAAFGDAAPGDTDAALRIALREEGSFLDHEVVDPSSGNLIPQPGIEIHPSMAPWPTQGDDLGSDHVLLFTDDSVILPYLPDPLAIGVALTGYDLAGAEILHVEAPFPGSWPDLHPFRVRVSETTGTQPTASFTGGVLEVRLPKSHVVRARLSSIFAKDDLDLFAVWNLIDAPSADLEQRVLEGRHWMLTPFRWLTFTHAVQQPLKEPSFAAVQAEARPVGATSATFVGPIACHAKSTGRLDVMAAWHEDVDLLTDKRPRWEAEGTAVVKEARAFGFDIDPAEDAAPVTIVRHVQDGWRWCRRCEGLFFGGDPTKGACPAAQGAPHTDDASGNYVLAHNDPSAPGQPDWRWCSKCQGLFFGGNPTPGACPATPGQPHLSTGSGNYTLIHQDPTAPGQDGWRWCSNCQGLAWGADEAGACPAGGVHDHGGSGVYTLRTVVTAPQDRISRHEFGDTKYRRVEYRTIATTRFREYLPPTLGADDATVLQRQEPTIKLRDILSSARPAAPDVVSIVPTFQWQTSETGGTTVHTRRGNGVRVYVRRPWFSSGDGEQLGVVLRNPVERVFQEQPRPVLSHTRVDRAHGYANLVTAAPVTSRAGGAFERVEAAPAADVQPLAEMEAVVTPVEESLVIPSVSIAALVHDPLGGYVTTWGSDPVWRSANPTESPSAFGFPAHVSFGANLTLQELPSGYQVAVAGHAVQYREDRQLWFCDVDVDMGDAYFPFVRLALARYQPKSVDDAHLSRVVMTDFIQLTPDRTASMTMEDGSAEVMLEGVFGQNWFGFFKPFALEQPDPSTSVWARLEVNEDPINADLSWRAASDPVELTPTDLNGFRATWSAHLPIPQGAVGAGTHRILITETERYRRDEEPDDPVFASGKHTYTRERIVFADTFEL